MMETSRHLARHLDVSRTRGAAAETTRVAVARVESLDVGPSSQAWLDGMTSFVHSWLPAAEV